MNKGNKSSFWLTFIMPKITGLFLVHQLSLMPIQAQTLPSNATPSPSTTSSNPAWIEQSSPLIGWIAAIVTGVVSVITSMQLVERKNQHIAKLDAEIKRLEKDDDFVNGLIVHLATQSENMTNMVEKLSETPAIATSQIYQELRQKINEHHADITTIPQTLNSYREAKKWLARKQIQKSLTKSAFDKALEIYLEEFGTATELEKNAISTGIANCINLLIIYLDEGTDVRKTNINKSEIISKPQTMQSCIKSLEYIKIQKLPEYLSKGEVSRDALQEVEKYLDFLILMLSG